MRRKSGVYKVINTENNRIYIGASRDLYQRKMNHLSKIKHKCHANKKIMIDIEIYEYDVFKFEIIEMCESHELKETEHYYIKKLQPFYNTAIKDRLEKIVRFNIEMPLDFKMQLIKYAKRKNIPMCTYALRAFAEQLKKDMSYE